MNSLVVKRKRSGRAVRFGRRRNHVGTKAFSIASASLLAMLILPAVTSGQEEAPAPDFPPKKFEPRRYDTIVQKNPFVREVQVVASEEVVEDWAKDLTIRGYSKLDGKYVVHLENKKLRTEKDFRLRRLRFMRLIEGEPLDVSGWGGPSKLTLRGVVPSRDPKLVEVRIEGDIGGGQSKSATVRYDEKDLQGNTNTRLPTAAPQPGAVPAPPGATSPPRVEGRGGRRGGDRGGGDQGRGRNGGDGAAQEQPARRVVLPPGIPQP